MLKLLLPCALLLMLAEPVEAAPAKIQIANFTFEPQQMEVKAGTTVTWTNRDDIPHAIVSAGKFKSRPLDTDEEFSFTFTAPGTYQYFCSLHPHMTGTIVVRAAIGGITSP
jgi:plastocyanin